ncbi:hypothetical protein NY2A_B618R [Paramecium bursaria Chlorella virus NY2A]|uniref:Uncharacterized protein B618R n=1 Tax=Paramecium bursaria Chlorella virus NY2A TaxID=46021 RepID=A7IXE3_PBCVN|nr:hypothetical protein NY2A_B618R [Paramecium bursaria Chlorella virus NY2A]ABT15017.1 hypothetical protein NY2A_B618R [Paramecium bursaria Chlorella virus NY2A]
MTHKKIIDCFIFYNELDLLNYRLHTLNDIVDYFIIVESTHTFSGKEKELFFTDNKHLFEKFKDKIIHIVVDDFPYKYPDIDYQNKEQWKNEYYQRNSISIGLDKLNIENNDIIIISDVDEIPDINRLYEIKHYNCEISVCALEMDLYYYNLNSLCGDKWSSCKIISYDTYKELKLTCNEIRELNCMRIRNGGWHLSYFGDTMFIKNKIHSFSHQELNLDIFTDIEKIEQRVKNCSDVYDRHDNIVMNIPISSNNYLPHEYEKYLKKFYKM